MTRFLPAAVAAILLLPLAPSTDAADAKAQLQELVTKVKAKLKEGKKTEADLAEDLKAFDAIVAEHKGEKTDDVAEILFMKAMLYSQVIEDDAKATTILNQIKTDFPGTDVAKKADQTIASLASQAGAKKIQQTLVEGAPFPDFQEMDLNGKPLSVSQFKGKVVLIDFWATWCGPCVQELPNVLKAYEQYHGKGFEIIGISLDSEKEKLTAFIEKNKMTWPQYFDGKGWESKLGAKYGVNSIPATYLLDKEGKIIGKGLRGDALVKAVGAALN
jgi:peroxiredoxin